MSSGADQVQGPACKPLQAPCSEMGVVVVVYIYVHGWCQQAWVMQAAKAGAAGSCGLLAFTIR